MNDKKEFTCSRCGKGLSASEVKRVGLRLFCNTCADEYMIDDAIRQLVTVPGRS